MTADFLGPYARRMFPTGIWNNPMWKTAARAGLRRISQMVSQGNIAGANRLAKTPGVLKASPAGSQMRHLGAGGEGTADLVAHPQHGVAVRKLYDPEGLASQEMIQRKEQMGRAAGANPNVAQFYGSAPTPNAGGTMHFSEYVGGPGSHAAPAAGSATEARALRHATNQTQIAARQAGFTGAKDVRKDNMAWDSRSGQFKSIDSMPYHRGEYVENRQNRPGQPVWMQDRPTGQAFAIEDKGLQSQFTNPDPQHRRDIQSVVSPTGRNEAVSNPMAVPHEQRLSAGGLKNYMLGNHPQAGVPASQTPGAAATHAATRNLNAPAPRPAGTQPTPTPMQTAPARPQSMKPQLPQPGTLTRAMNAIQVP